MQLVDVHNAEEYLRHTGRIAKSESVIATELAGGVSNVVLLINPTDGSTPFVIKQVREQLRVPDPWYCSIERIWREVEVLDICHRAIAQSPLGAHERRTGIFVPALLFCDRENYLYAMSAVPDHEVWKAQLLRGDVRQETALACGAMLGGIHAATWLHPDLTVRLRDTSFFDALRLDPYYRHVARQRPDLAPQLYGLIDSLNSHARCLVHGDFSPKNLLVHADGVTLIDFEVGHFGDPAFDLGFFLTHLVLKAIRAADRREEYLQLTRSFWDQYESSLRPTCGRAEFSELVTRAIANLAGCMLARVDGKSRVDYLDATQQEVVRQLSQELLNSSPTTWDDVTRRIHG